MKKEKIVKERTCVCVCVGYSLAFQLSACGMSYEGFSFYFLRFSYLLQFDRSYNY